MVSLGSFRDQPLRRVLSGLIPAVLREYRPSIIFCACSFTLVFSLLLGGGTHGGFLSDAILELLAIPALLIATSSLVDLLHSRTKIGTDLQWVLAFCFALALLPLMQLVPLPPWLWTSLPGREEMKKVFDLLGGGGTPWMPISVSPHLTWLSLLSLLPPMAIFLAAIQLNYRERRTLTLIIVAIGVVSVFVGLTQVAEGPASALRFFTITNDTEAVGFFANRNHYAAFLYVVLLFAAVWVIDVAFKIESWTDIRNFQTTTIIAITASFLVFVVIIAGEAMARSRAGLALTIVALLAIFALGFMDRRNAAGSGPSKLLIAATTLAITLSVQLALYRILGRFGPDPLESARSVFAHNTIAAAKAFTPFGSGLGTFVPVYEMFERPGDVLADTYANHAHNDILELWLETGLLGPILLCLFVTWVAFSGVKLWRRPPPDLSSFDCTLGRAATVVIGLLLAHSVVDYPMRTEAIMAVFAVSCALLIAPLRSEEDPKPVAVTAARDKLVRKQPPKPQAVRAGSSSLGVRAVPGQGTEGLPTRPRQFGGRWGEGVDWPEEWQNSGDRKSSQDGQPRTDTDGKPESGADS
jgi:O-antigen ligase